MTKLSSHLFCIRHARGGRPFQCLCLIQGCRHGQGGDLEEQRLRCRLCSTSDIRVLAPLR